MSSNKTTAPHSLPIPIDSRRRSESSSDSSSSASTSPASPLPSPVSGTLPRIAPISPSTSPILSYFLAQSPKSPPSATFPFRRGIAGAPPLFEDDDAVEEKQASRHARRASAAAWPAQDRLPPSSVAPVPPQHQERAAGLLRRLSLGGNMVRPPIPVMKPPTNASAAVGMQRSSTPPGTQTRMPPNAASPRKARRANTMAPGTPRPPRAPSPMGERILKGHFDGFN